jgi:hypothetical protein
MQAAVQAHAVNTGVSQRRGDGNNLGAACIFSLYMNFGETPLHFPQEIIKTANSALKAIVK